MLGTYMELQVGFCYDWSWDGNYTSQDFQPYMVCLLIHPDKKE